MAPPAVAEKIERRRAGRRPRPAVAPLYLVAEYFDRCDSLEFVPWRGAHANGGGTGSMRLNYSVTPEPSCGKGIQRLADANAAMEGGGALPRRT